MESLSGSLCVCLVPPAPVRPVKVLKVWPESAPEQLSLLPLLSCAEPGGQVSISSISSKGTWCSSGGDGLVNECVAPCYKLLSVNSTTHCITLCL